MKKHPRLALLLSLLASACGSSTGSSTDGAISGSDGGTSADGAVAATVTYWQDVLPIVGDKCMKCHQPTGIAPFDIGDYQMTKLHGALIVAKTQNDLMPPYFITHDGTCGQFEDAEALTDAQKATLKAWVDGGMIEGTKATLTTPPKQGLPAGADTADYKTPMFAPVAQGTALAQYDEYRCFPVDTALAKDRYITGYEVTPGDDKIVHHVVAFIIDPNKVTASGKTNKDVMAALHAADKDPSRPGWPCFGLAGDGVEIDSIPTVWAPGQGPVSFPDGMGVRQHPTDQLVVQIHYNLADPKFAGMTDQTTVRYRYADTVNRRLVFTLSDGFLDTLSKIGADGKPAPAFLPPGQMSTKFSWKKSGAEMGIAAPLPYVDLMAVMPHMHQRGRAKEMRVTDDAGQDACMAQVKHWDFTWQKYYFYKGTPPRLTPTSEIQLTCEYDTSMDTNPVLPGWGTRNEMCIAILMLALPPGI